MWSAAGVLFAHWKPWRWYIHFILLLPTPSLQFHFAFIKLSKSDSSNLLISWQISLMKVLAWCKIYNIMYLIDSVQIILQHSMLISFHPVFLRTNWIKQEKTTQWKARSELQQDPSHYHELKIDNNKHYLHNTTMMFHISSSFPQSAPSAFPAVLCRSYFFLTLFLHLLIYHFFFLTLLLSLNCCTQIGDLWKCSFWEPIK